MLKNLFDELSRSSEGNTYSNHIEKLNTVLQKELNKHNLPISIKMLPVKVTNFRINRLNKDRKFHDDDSQAWDNQIETLVDVIVKVFKDPAKSAVLIGSTQLGKTMLVILCSVVEAILYIKTGVKYKTIYLSPNKVSLGDQMIEDYKSFSAFYDFEISSTDWAPFRYSDYKSGTHLGGEEHIDVPVFRVSKSAVDKKVKKYIEAIHSEGARVIFILDECHYGSDQNGVLKSVLNIAKNLVDKSQGDIMIAISATPFQLGNLQSLSKVFCRTYKGYVGYAFWNGQLLDPRYPLIIPDHIAFNSPRIEKEFGVKELQWINRKFYRKESHYEKEKNKRITPFSKRWQGYSHEEYRNFCAEKFAQLVNSCLITHNVLNGKGFINRFFHKNSEALEFINKYKNKFDPKIKLVAWQGDDAKVNLSKFLNEQNILPNDLKVIFVTGSGRMGNRIQDEDKIYYGADFSPNSNLTAVLQGLLGRMTGKKSVPPIMFFEKKICDELDLYVSSRGKGFKRTPHNRATLVGESHRGKDIAIYINDAKEHQISFPSLGYKEYGEWLQNWVEKTLGSRNTLERNRISFESKETFWNKMNNEFFSNLESALGIEKNSFMRYNPDASDDELSSMGRPFVNDEGHAYHETIGFRTVGKQAATNSTLSSDRVKTGKKGKRKLQVQIHAKRVYNKWKAIVIKFRFCETTTIGSNIVLTKTNDIGYDFATKMEREAILRSGERK